MKNLIKLFTVCSLLVLASCSSKPSMNSFGEVEMEVEVGEGFLENLRKFQQKTEAVVDLLESDEKISNVNILVKTDFNSESDESTSRFILLLHYDHVYDKDNNNLDQVGKHALQRAIDIFQNASYDRYVIKFLRSNSSDYSQDSEVLKTYEYTLDQLTSEKKINNREA
jgi:hypothetical protein